MSALLHSNQRAKKSLSREPAAETLPSDPQREGRSSRVFFCFSALVHFVVAVALSTSWAVGRSASQAPSQTAAAIPERPAVARMPIDVGPVKFSDMKIETLIGHVPSQAAP